MDEQHRLLPPDGKTPALIPHRDQPGKHPASADAEWLIRRGFEQSCEEGFALLYRRYYANLCSHAVRYVLAKEVAEDLVTDIFLGIWEKQTFNQITTCYGAYLYRAVRNRAYNYVRHELNQTRPLTPVDDDDFSQPDTPETVLHGHDLIQRLDAEIQALPAQCRRAFILSRYEGKRYAEIATELAISPKGVEHLITRALSRLRKHLSGDWLITFLFLILNF